MHEVLLSSAARRQGAFVDPETEVAARHREHRSPERHLRENSRVNASLNFASKPPMARSSSVRRTAPGHSSSKARPDSCHRRHSSMVVGPRSLFEPSVGLKASSAILRANVVTTTGRGATEVNASRIRGMRFPSTKSSSPMKLTTSVSIPASATLCDSSTGSSSSSR